MSITGFVTATDWEQYNSSLLIEVTRPNGVFTCTGVAISPTIIVTAAHCLDGAVKSVKIFTNDRYDPKAPSFEIEKYYLHPSYSPKKSQYFADIAKIQMKTKLPDFVRIYPIFEGANPTGEIYRFGFGARNKKNVRTVVTPKMKRMNLSEYTLELYDQFSRSGDSGGPVYLKNGPVINLLAIHSTFSHGPEGNYSYNPLLGSYLSWIYRNEDSGNKVLKVEQNH